jgi:hypothetical protein
MEFDTSTWMMIAFVIAMVLSMWKMYPFLVNKTLEDDDTGEDSYEYLVAHMYKVLKQSNTVPSVKELHIIMIEHEEFDKKKFWRFNQNKLQQLLHRHYNDNPHLNSIEDIIEDLD